MHVCEHRKFPMQWLVSHSISIETRRCVLKTLVEYCVYCSHFMELFAWMSLSVTIR